MTVQSQAMQAGISFDLLQESDLTNLSRACRQFVRLERWLLGG
jgi:hypothetical protein